MQKHQPGEESRRRVRDLVVAGSTQPMIAKVLGIAEKTLRLHYREELDTALEDAIGKVSGTLLRKALDGDTASMIFFLKVRGKDKGWSERLEHTGKDGGSIKTEDMTARDLLADRIARLTARTGESDAPEGAD